MKRKLLHPVFTKKMMSFFISLFFTLVSVGTLYAASATYNSPLYFYAPRQSFWGPGGSSLDFQQYGDTGGDVGLYYDAWASTGTVASYFNGGLSVRYNDLSYPGTTNLNIGFDGYNDEGFFNTHLGASLELGYYVHADNVDVTGVLYETGYQWDINKYFEPAMDTKFSGTDSLVLVNVERIEIPPNAGSAGGSAAISQTANFTADSIDGILTYKHRDVGITKETHFSIDSNGDISLPVELDQQGYWDFYVSDIDLINRFSTGFDFHANAYVDSVIDWSGEVNIPLYRTPEFPLAFNQIDSTAAFSIYSAPEPASMILFVIGGGALVLAKKRKNKKGELIPPFFSQANDSRKG